MKTLIAILVSGSVSFGAAYFYVSNQKHAEAQRARSEQEQQWQAHLDRLERELKAARNKPGRVEQITETVEVERPRPQRAGEVMARLTQLKPAGGGARYQSVREIIHQLETLREAGPAALPTIRAFLAQNQDISYERERENNGNEDRGGAAPAGPGAGGGSSPNQGPGGGDRGRGGPPPWVGNQPGSGGELPRTDNYYPYSLRLGLFDVVKAIGGPEAEQILAEVLQTTGRGAEVAHLTNLLEELAPGKYVGNAVASAKDLLANPVAIPNPTRLDEYSKGYLYAVLRRFNDTSFVATAQSLVVGTDGRIDRSALNYITQTLKEQSLSTLHVLYQDARVTNLWDKASVISTAMNYVGSHPQADQMFREVLANEQIGPARYMTLGRLDNGDLSEQTIRNRQRLLAEVRATVTDERVQRAIDGIHQNLERKLNPAAEGERGRRPDGRGASPGGGPGPGPGR